MFLLNWYREYLEIKNEQKTKAKELQYCEACETLGRQLAIANEERKMLIEKLTAEKVIPEEPKQIENPKAVMPVSLRWSARQQALQAESRNAAKVLQKKKDEEKQSSAPLTVAEIEKELEING